MGNFGTEDASAPHLNQVNQIALTQVLVASSQAQVRIGRRSQCSSLYHRHYRLLHTSPIVIMTAIRFPALQDKIERSPICLALGKVPTMAAIGICNAIIVEVVERLAGVPAGDSHRGIRRGRRAQLARASAPASSDRHRHHTGTKANERRFISISFSLAHCLHAFAILLLACSLYFSRAHHPGQRPPGTAYNCPISECSPDDAHY